MSARPWRSIAAALAITASCGRINFAPRDDAGGDSAAGDDDDALMLSPATGPASLAVSSSGGCALVAGEARCWNTGLSAQPIAGLTDAVRISAGLQHYCALRSNGAIACWGQNVRAQLGDGTTNASPTTAVAASIAPPGAVDVAAGRHNTCAIYADGTARCWGGNFFGELGDGSMTDRPTIPSTIAGYTDIVAVSMGYQHSCVLRRNGRVACMGDGTSGELGDGSATVSSVPLGVLGLDDVIAVSARWYTSCAVRRTGELVCWGDNFCGQIDATGNDALTPVAIPGVQSGTSVSVGWVEYACAIDAGLVSCWGDGNDGNLGDGMFSGCHAPPPVTAIGVTDVVEIGTGDYFTCARRTSGEVLCWGGGSLNPAPVLGL